MPSQNLDFWDRFNLFFTSPSQFFESIKTQEWTGAIVFFSLIAVFSVVLGYLVSILLQYVNVPILGYYGSSSLLLNDVFGVVYPIVSIVRNVFYSFIGAGILLLFAKIFGSEESYATTYKHFVYSSAPTILLSSIPFVNLLTGIYSIYLTYVGYRVLHKFSSGRAIAAIAIPALVIALVVIGFVTILYFVFLNTYL
ncbi:MAG: YIP1 family protein [Candidatus Aenigmarchaeota archaeon]|nr:YIP1 family protein [Candidatus Aenigmarchaeota archaeon]